MPVVTSTFCRIFLYNGIGRITKIVLFSGILIGGEIGIVTIMNCNVPEKRLMEKFLKHF